MGKVKDKNEGKERKGAYQPSLESVYKRKVAVDREADGKEDERVIDDKDLEKFRTAVIEKCYEAGLDSSKIAKISSLLSTDRFTIPRSASSVSAYIPNILAQLRKETQSPLSGKYALSICFSSLACSFCS